MIDVIVCYLIDVVGLHALFYDHQYRNFDHLLFGALYVRRRKTNIRALE